MEVRPLEPFADVLVIAPEVYRDERGHFLETWREERYREAGAGSGFAQDNLSRSRAGVVRGLHFQHPHGQGKLIQSVRGTVWDVAVDVRVGSPTFGHWAAVELAAGARTQLWIPPGFAHGFAALEAPADVHYKCTAPYRPEAEHTLRWDDPEVGIEWPVEEPILSEKDRAGEPLEALRAAGHLPSFG